MIDLTIHLVVDWHMFMYAPILYIIYRNTGR